jgi:hypothetical protein
MTGAMALDDRGRPRLRRRDWTSIVLAVIVSLSQVLLLAYLLWVAWLNLWATEGDVPPASSLSFPVGNDVVDEEITCGSGGCTVIYTVRPPEGQPAAALAEELGTTPETTVSGTFLDPRTSWLSAEPRGRSLTISAGYVTAE